MKLLVDREDMTIDLLLWQRLQRNDEALVIAVIAANPGLAALGVVLPVGTRIEVPDVAPEPVKKTVKLWD